MARASGNAALYLSDALMRLAGMNRDKRQQESLLARQDAQRAEDIAYRTQRDQTEDSRWREQFDARNRERLTDLAGRPGYAIETGAPMQHAGEAAPSLPGLGMLGSALVDLGLNKDRPQMSTTAQQVESTTVGGRPVSVYFDPGRVAREKIAAANAPLTPYQREQIRLEEGRLGETIRSNRAGEANDRTRLASAGSGGVNWQVQSTDQGLVQVDPRTGNVRPVVMDGDTLGPYQKPDALADMIRRMGEEQAQRPKSGFTLRGLFGGKKNAEAAQPDGGVTPVGGRQKTWQDRATELRKAGKSEDEVVAALRAEGLIR